MLCYRAAGLLNVDCFARMLLVGVHGQLDVHVGVLCVIQMFENILITFILLVTFSCDLVTNILTSFIRMMLSSGDMRDTTHTLCRTAYVP